MIVQQSLLHFYIYIYVYIYILFLFYYSHVDRLFTFLRKWTVTAMGRSLRRRFWKIKKRSWTAKWQTTADSCTYHTMNCSQTLLLHVVYFFFLIVSLKLCCSSFSVVALWLYMWEKCPSTVVFDLVVGRVCDMKCYFKITDNLIVHTTPSPASPSKYSQSNASQDRSFPYFYSPSIKKNWK